MIAAALLGLIIFAALFAAFRIVSLASVGAALSIPLFAFFISADDSVSLAAIGIALLIVLRHHSNLMRLSLGQEPPFKFKH